MSLFITSTRIVGLDSESFKALQKTVTSPEHALEVFAPHACVCGAATAWEIEPPAYTDGGVRLRCHACRLAPDPSWWIPQGNRKRRTKGAPTITEVTKERGAFCYGCGLDESLLLQFRIRLYVHHARAYQDAGHAGPYIPLCGVCHEIVTFTQKTVRRFLPTASAHEDVA